MSSFRHSRPSGNLRRMALTLRLTLCSHGRQTVVLRKISTRPRSGERGYI